MKAKTRNKHIEQLAQWLALPEDEREPKTLVDWSKQHGVTDVTAWNWKKQITVKPELSEVELFKMRLYKEATKVGAPAKTMELWAKLNGLFEDKTERKEFEFKPSDYIKNREKARRELEEEGFGSREVQSIPSLLPDEVLLHSGQGEEADGEVAGVGEPSRPADLIPTA